MDRSPVRACVCFDEGRGCVVSCRTRVGCLGEEPYEIVVSWHFPWSFMAVQQWPELWCSLMFVSHTAVNSFMNFMTAVRLGPCVPYCRRAASFRVGSLSNVTWVGEHDVIAAGKLLRAVEVWPDLDILCVRVWTVYTESSDCIERIFEKFVKCQRVGNCPKHEALQN
jgi:hypothetical protein